MTRFIRSRLLAPVLLLLVLPGLGGCILWHEPGGQLTASSLSDADVRLTGEFDHAAYRAEGDDRATLVLIEGPLDRPEQAVVIRMFWRPRAARTPIDPSATNATINYIVFADHEGQREAGVYSGAGYLFPHDRPGKHRLEAGVWEARLRLTDASTGFQDLLGHAQLRGKLLAHQDGRAVSDWLRRLNIATREALGYPRLVRLAEPAEPDGARPRG